MVPEYLDQDELDYELLIRSVEDIGAMSDRKKRKMLAKALGYEKQNEIFLIRYLKSDVGEEIVRCEDKLKEHEQKIRSNVGVPEQHAFRLVHLGYRLINLQNTPMIPPVEWNRVMSLLYSYSRLMSEILDTEAAGGDEQEQNEESFSPTKKLAESTFRDDVIGQKRRLANSPLLFKANRKQAREDEKTDITDIDLAYAFSKLKGLRAEAKKHSEQDQKYNASNPFQIERNSTNPFWNMGNDEFNPPTNKGAIPKQQSGKLGVRLPDTQQKRSPTTNPGEPDEKQIPLVDVPRQKRENPFFNPNWPKVPVSGPISQLAHVDNNRGPSRDLPERLAFSDPRLANNPTYFVKKLPVSNWKLRYAGDDQGMQLNEFLWQVHHHVMAEQTTEHELLRSAYHLFTGLAREWYMRNFYNFSSWSEVITGLRQEFQHPDMDYAIRMQIYSRKQQRNESFKAFYSDILKKSRGLGDCMSDEELIATVCRNVRTDFRRSLMLVQINSLRELEMWGNKLDSLTPILWQTAETNTVSYEEAQQDSQSKFKYTEMENSFTPTGKGKQLKPQPQKQENQIKPQNYNDRFSIERKSQEYVDQYKPPNWDVCFNCRQTGHIAKNCEGRRKRYCWKCGLEGEQTKSCRYCSKNVNRTA